MSPVEAINKPIIDGTNITAGDVLSLARRDYNPIQEVPFDDLQQAGLEGLSAESIESVRYLLSEGGVRSVVKKRALSLLSNIAHLARTATERERLEEDLAKTDEPTLF